MMASVTVALTLYFPILTGKVIDLVIIKLCKRFVLMGKRLHDLLIPHHLLDQGCLLASRLRLQMERGAVILFPFLCKPIHEAVQRDFRRGDGAA